MKNVWKLMWLMGIIALVAVMAFAYIVLPTVPPTEVLHMVLSACILLVAWHIVRGISAVHAKRHTTATGFG